MEKELLRLILQYNFYEENKSQIYRTIFSNEVAELFDIIVETHNKLKRNLSVAELKELYKVNYPTATKAKLDNIFFILDELPSEIHAEVAKEVLKKAYIIEAGRQISQIGIDIVNGKTASFTKAREILEKIEAGSFSDGEELEQVSDELEDILEQINITTAWKYNIAQLAEVASGTGPGIFIGAFGRVEVGKSAFGVSLAAAPGGFCEQGAILHYYCNEEAAARTKGRAVMAYTGMPFMELSLNLPEAKARYSNITKQLKFFECKGKNVQDIASHISKHKPDVIIVDQLDKLEVSGSFAREDERLGELYVRFRDCLTKFNCAGLALSQANADAEGKTILNTTNMALARTSKAAECDVLIGIGKSSLHSENTRILNMIKNKVNGGHADVVCQLLPEISRYVS